MEGDFPFSYNTIDLNAPFGGGSSLGGAPGMPAPPVLPGYQPQMPAAPTRPGAGVRQPSKASPSAPGRLEQPGTYESYWASIAPQFQQPGYAENSYGEVTGGYRNLMQQPGPSYAQDAYGAFASSPQTANLDAYYDEAWAEGSDRMNREFASRGAYNSSAATNNLSGLARKLGADKARESAAYALDRARTGGALASSASSEAAGNTTRQAGLLDSIFGAGQAVDASRLGRNVAGLAGAQTAQSMEEGRLRGGLEDAFQYSGTLADTYSDQQLRAIAADMEAQGVPHEMAMAMARLQMDSFAQQSNNLLGTAGAVADLASAF